MKSAGWGVRDEVCGMSSALRDEVCGREGRSGFGVRRDCRNMLSEKCVRVRWECLYLPCSHNVCTICRRRKAAKSICFILIVFALLSFAFGAKQIFVSIRYIVLFYFP